MSDNGDHWTRVTFNISHRLISLDTEYYHDESDSLSLSDDVQAAYNNDPQNAKIFHETKTGNLLSPYDFVSLYLKKKNIRKQELISKEKKAEAFNKGKAVCILPFNFDFTTDAYHVITNRGAVNLKILRLKIELTVTPQKQS